MRRRRLPRNPKARPKVRLTALRHGFAEGMQGASDKHLHQYASLPDSFIKEDSLAKIMKDSAKKEIVRRKALMKKWGQVYPSYKLTAGEKAEIVQDSIKKGISPVYHFYKNALVTGRFADELIKVMDWEQKKLEGFFRALGEKMGLVKKRQKLKYEYGGFK